LNSFTLASLDDFLTSSKRPWRISATGSWVGPYFSWHSFEQKENSVVQPRVRSQGIRGPFKGDKQWLQHPIQVPSKTRRGESAKGRSRATTSPGDKSFVAHEYRPTDSSPSIVCVKGVEFNFGQIQVRAGHNVTSVFHSKTSALCGGGDACGKLSCSAVS
jgi:hypothetical protein